MSPDDYSNLSSRNKDVSASAVALHLGTLSRKWGRRHEQVNEANIDLSRLAKKLEGRSQT